MTRTDLEKLFMSNGIAAVIDCRADHAGVAVTVTTWSAGGKIEKVFEAPTAGAAFSAAYRHFEYADLSNIVTLAKTPVKDTDSDLPGTKRCPRRL